MKTCYIVGAGEFTPRGLHPKQGDFIIAADGGYRALQSVSIRPDLLMGDLDSLGCDYPLPADLPVERFPVQKDDTDTGIALAKGWALGFRDFALYGCGGGRIDHLLANFQSMCRCSQMGASIRLVDEAYDAYALSGGTLHLPDRPAGTIVSVFCLTGSADGVTIEGLMYPLQNAALSNIFPLGVSNQHTGQAASITVQTGTLLILQHLQ